jgi:hypothetical protein
MTANEFFLCNLALAFYNAGTIWAHEIDIFRTWKLIGRTEFHTVHLCPRGARAGRKYCVDLVQAGTLARVVRLDSLGLPARVDAADRRILGSVAGPVGDRPARSRKPIPHEDSQDTLVAHAAD